ncbi:FAD-dependent monooxygenase [Kitasatospora sp. NPDC002227]|uniref:FAD-dependent monooxygenase n=1 Tax=Kitasatospora sp. NPDC002227 TaxID=3154773 RepID=UPI00331F37C3
MRGGRVAVVGGSIAGCSAALAATRTGAAEVVVFERAPGRLQDRGVGLALQSDRYTELEAAGYLDAAMPWERIKRRPWVVRDGEVWAGREIGALPFPFRSYNWGSLWQELRSRIPAGVDYRTGAAVTEVRGEPDGAAVRLPDGSWERFDLVIGADGYRSTVRAAMHPGTAAEYGGYVAWRGTLSAEQLPERAAEAFPEGDALTVAFPSGHMIVYRIPGPGGVGTDVNWVFYAAPPEAAAQRFADPSTTHPRAITEDLAAYQQQLVDAYFPPFWQEVMRRTPAENTFVQPMYDMAVPRFTEGRLALLGDAASIARPNTGSGAIKAVQDAAALERALRTHDSLDEGLAAYSAERAPIGRATVELGRSLGRAQVLETPDWPAMDQAEVERWWLGAGGGKGFGGHALGGAAR